MRTAPALFALALTLCACLENDEEITVRPDGSVAVFVSAKGSTEDLADGYSTDLPPPLATTQGSLARIGEYLRR